MKLSTPLVRIGTRGSRLALAQAGEVRERLAAVHAELGCEGAVELVAITTTGDRVRDRPLADIGGKGLFCKEIEQALLENRIDAAVHSMKDVETVLADGTAIAAVLPREDPRDAFLSPGAADIADLPRGAVVGTSSVRRAAQLRARRADLRIVPFRGNVDTRLARLDEGAVAATLLALAGLRRLGLEERATRILPVEDMLPAVGQGAIGIQCRVDDQRVFRWMQAISHRESELAVRAERAMLAELDGTCRTPIAGHARFVGPDRLRLSGWHAGTELRSGYSAERDGPAHAPEELGHAVGLALRRSAGADALR